MAPVEQQHPQLPPQYRQALLDQQKRQQQQQHVALSTQPTLQDIENKHSQLPPQYRQAVLEQQQKEHQQRLLQQQQQQQQQQQPGSPRYDPQRQPQSASVTSSPNGNSSSKGSATPGRRASTTHQRIVSAPLLSSYRPERSGSFSTISSPGPSRAHWKPDSSSQVCTWPGCLREFGFFDRRHHCRKCGDIFCSAHCSKAVPLDQALDFNPAMGIMSRACTGCYEAYEQWQGLVPATSFATQHSIRGPFGFVSDSQIAGEYSSQNKNINSGSMTPAIIKKSEGLLDQAGTAVTSETLGREDIVRPSRPTTENIAIKTRPVQ
ncbi:hypothetical protein BGZ98_004639, partial [Dissophora globulifera]